jgi:glycerol-3-phosphate O-acyltransferase
MDFLSLLKSANENGEISEKIYLIFHDLFVTYSDSLPQEMRDQKINENIFKIYLERVKEEFKNPHKFPSYHSRITHPFDYYTFGLDFIRPMMDFDKSEILGTANLDKIENQLKRGENAILYANHQTEIDPQILSVALEKSHPLISQEIIFVAGDRVVTDPMAIPFSLGRNLLCIYSKRHIDKPPEKKMEKQLHNQKTMRMMKDLLSEGGKCIYVAPSGGRDRIDPKTGEVNVSPFDPNNIEMFRLMASTAAKSTHFYSLSLVTYDILPPPIEIESEIGEMRVAKRSGVFLSFGDEIDMDSLHTDQKDRHARRNAVAQSIWQRVSDDYKNLLKRKSSA